MPARCAVATYRTDSSDRQAAAALEDDVEHRVVRMVVALAVAAEAVAHAEHLAQRVEPGVRPVGGARAATSSPSSSSSASAAASSTSRNSAASDERELVERRLGLRGEDDEGLDRHQPHCRPRAGAP